ncbi:uncharacterized protein J3D65DRAFT_331570 [Phyllosticta citribraziliensis]|uniref:Uncharacterized protein n=1 Tax=Phyllosticta citribraziliensis TaxID=989973 RepID=A0ABR1LTL4_9PEZI
MASHQKNIDTIDNMPNPMFQLDQSTRAADSLCLGDDLAADTDEPPDEMQSTPRPTTAKPILANAAGFTKTRPTPCSQKQSLLTQALHSESESASDEEHHEFQRGFSNTSTWSTPSIASTAELTSDGGFTSPGTRASSPSPPLPFMQPLPALTFELPKAETSLRICHEDHVENVTTTVQKTATNETVVEAGLGRKRCITFACGKKETTTTTTTSTTTQEHKPAEQGPRVRAVKFACSVNTTPRKPRCSSPPPPPRQTATTPKTPRAHRDSDSTVKNDSPKTVRKAAPMYGHSRKFSASSDICRREATRFHEFASSEEEIEEWTQEQTCHKSRLTVRDTLTIENGLRRLGEEVEEEALEDEENDVEDEDDELDEDDDDLDADDDDDEEEAENEDDEDDVASIASHKTVSTAGFQTDDEGGFAVSDDESDAGSDYQWWAPGRTSAVALGDQAEHIRPNAGHRSFSDSSTESLASATGSVHMFHKSKRTPKQRKPVAIRPHSPELPDSTDFVCGTLDEDRPLEAAYYSALEQRRAAKHKAVPQDIDPTFPTSDPEMEDDEDDDDVEVIAKEDESDQHMLMHGQLDQIHEVGGRGRSRAGSKRSPGPSPKRLRSPPPRRAACLSPKRPRSPAPALRLRSPAPNRRPCLAAASKAHQAKVHCARMGNGHVPTLAASLPRPSTVFNVAQDDDDEESESHNDTLKRGPMDIKAGTALKRQRRKEKLYMKHCRKQCKEKERRPAPGRGVERMKEMGLGLAAYKGKRAEPVHVLSY